MKLFRKQARDYRPLKVEGAVLFARMPGADCLTYGLGAVMIALLLYIAAFQYTREIRVPGVLALGAGAARVPTGQKAVIVEVGVTEGQHVSKGDVLFRVNSDRFAPGGEDVQRVVSRLLSERRESFTVEAGRIRNEFAARLRALVDHRRSLEEEIARLSRQIELQRNRLSIAQQDLARASRLLGEGFVSSSALQDKQANVLDHEQKLAELEGARSRSKREAEGVDADVDALRATETRELAQALRNEKAMEQDTALARASNELLVRAPVAGIATGVNASVGQIVESSQVLVAIVQPASAVRGELYVPSRAIAFARRGDIVSIRYQAFPYQKFGVFRGVIEQVSTVPMAPSDLDAAVVPAGMISGGAAQPLYRITVELDRKAIDVNGILHPLRPGMLLDASLHLETRRLYEWAIEPLLTIARRS